MTAERMPSEASDPRTVLVVEDSEPCAATLELALQGLRGLTARFTTTAEEAIEVLDSGPVSLIITDVRLPGANGFELVSHIRSDPRFSKLPIIITSGETAADTAANAMVCGADAFFGKPYSPRDLLKRLRELLA